MGQTKIALGIVGACGRGSAFLGAIRAIGGIRVEAVCDIDEAGLSEAAERLGAEEAYTDYEKMLDAAELDAVLVGTPMPLHASQSIGALERGIHVLCEVPAAVSVGECRALAAACSGSRAVYMMAENYTNIRENRLLRELCRRGLLGEPSYAEGEYLHELKELNETTPWRRKWQTGIRGITYGTHSLGPILQWLPGDRIARVCCEGSGSRFRDPRGEPYHDDTAVMLGKSVKGVLVKIRVDMISDRPHAMANYQLQGTDGAYESSRGGPKEGAKIWFRRLGDKICWHDVETLLADEEFRRLYLPDGWGADDAAAARAGHGGGDYYVIRDFLEAVRGDAPPSVGIHEALDMTLPGLMSQKSILAGGGWVEVPDSRSWTNVAQVPPPVDVSRPATAEASPPEQLEMVWPESLSPPDPGAPEGYTLRQLRDGDESGYLHLMGAAGFEGWNAERLGRVMRGVLPDGFFVVEHADSGAVVATAIANHCPAERHPFGGELGWVAVDPEHRGRSLGKVVCAAVVRRFQSAGYHRIYLKTDDFRLAAIKLYLGLGFRPSASRGEVRERWQAILSRLGWKEHA